jgi:signal transduction histidine kinase
LIVYNSTYCRAAVHWTRIREKIFDTFYTTKPEGIGLGLTISCSIIEAWRHLWATPNELGGVIFQFTLPAGLEETS